MSKTLDELKREAEASMKYRGHQLGKWQDGRRRSAADCKVCGMGVSVTPEPMCNEIDVGGRGVALDCPSGLACPNCEYLLCLDHAILTPTASTKITPWEARDAAFFIIGTCRHCKETIEVGVNIADKPIVVPF